MAEMECIPASRICRLCEICKPLTDFHKNKNCKSGGGIDSKCKKCHSAQSSENQKSEKAKLRKAKWAADKWRNDAAYRATKQSISREFFKKSEPRAKYANRSKERQAQNPEYYKALRKAQYERRKKNPGFLCSARIRARVRSALKDRRQKTFDLLGYSVDDLVAHLERQFLPGMSWSNMHEWHIDHIVSLSSLGVASEEDARRAWCLSNLRPLWASENLKKRDKRTHLL